MSMGWTPEDGEDDDDGGLEDWSRAFRRECTIYITCYVYCVVYYI